ncbi:family 16 glycosylhydrolase [Dyella tabacisoli]|uniref:Beta-glucanase n=1 Tax=Dyella tabacisoli TaxID=2282381 RepID=A0A369UHY9_9GAMM|nr:family 16 glycosylhydrolase [Dyella tabacisoli]RDD80372.1 glycoside hydrolase [Dyella tabacisoli]
MNIKDASGVLRGLIFSLMRAALGLFSYGRMSAFGVGDGKIGAILVINLDRQPQRWRRVRRELGRFRTASGAPLLSITRRLAAVDARDGRAVAATADVDTTYRVGDQLYVQPDARLEACFGANEPVRMTRQEIAVARSHIEVWKAVAAGTENHVLVLEDDVWFKRGAAAIIDRGWRAALRHCKDEGGPKLFYLSYADAGGTAERIELGDGLFHPLRGLWFLSGYVLSRAGAAALLRAMPVIGPVDLWMNYRFEMLGALALSSPAILQRQDAVSDNSYSIIPFLARAGTVDAASGSLPSNRRRVGIVLAWTAGGERESLAMGLSMLGLRVRVFDGDEDEVEVQDLPTLFGTFDAVINAPVAWSALSVVTGSADAKFLIEEAAFPPLGGLMPLPSGRTFVLPDDMSDFEGWGPLCAFLGLDEPTQAFPAGAERRLRVFRDDRPISAQRITVPLFRRSASQLDDSPWVLPAGCDWHPSTSIADRTSFAEELSAHTVMTTDPSLRTLVETFPGNLASFENEGLLHNEEGIRLIVSKVEAGARGYRSGAFASVQAFAHGRFEAEIKAAPGKGLVTGFFLHRDAPRQEIDVEIAGMDPTRMLVNVYFNPGDEGATMAFGYRGSPCRIDLGFDATLDFHCYAIEWQPGYIAWLVDGRVVHERVGWDPTPLPHLPMHLHGNLWPPRSEELAGKIDDKTLPATTTFRNVSVKTKSVPSALKATQPA